MSSRGFFFGELVDPQLIAYVRTQRQNGYSDEQIASALRSAGYPDSLISATLSSSSNDSVADSKVLRGYVQSQEAQGLSKEDIRSQLIYQGYSPKDVDAAFTVHHKKPLLFIFPILAIAVLIGGYFLISFEPEQDIQPAEHVRLSDVVENLLPLANSNPSAAVALCNRVVESDREDCFLTVSRASYDPALCSRIDSVKAKDACYLEFIYDGDLDYCEQLQDPNNIEYCDIVRKVAA